MVSSRAITKTIALLLMGGFANSQADPVPLPNPGLRGYAFPEAETTILGWVNQPTADHRYAIDLHGWGLWASLTAPSGQTEFGIPNVPVYFTWLTPGELADGTALTANAVGIKPKRTLQLELPRQFLRDKAMARLLENPVQPHGVPSTPKDARDTSDLDAVGYDPSAAAFAQKNNLFKKSTLKAMYQAGKTSIPTFPNTAVVIKPEYKVISKAHMLPGDIYVMPAWPGTPDASTVNPSTGFPEAAWPGCVYINIHNPGPSTASGIDKDCSGPTAQNTYGLGDFISYAVTAANVDQFKSLSTSVTIEAGDYLILVGMHVTSREISEWTWQSFFWTPNRAAPPLPSSASVAADQPFLKGSPSAHYAMTIGYQMVAPNQPVDEGKSEGTPVIVYNPYLEASLGVNVFSSTPANPGIYNPETKQTYKGTLGIQTNCMACHGSASVPFATGTGPGYITDFYVSRKDRAFVGSLQTDFLWSIPDYAK